MIHAIYLNGMYCAILFNSLNTPGLHKMETFAVHWHSYAVDAHVLFKVAYSICPFTLCNYQK